MTNTKMTQEKALVFALELDEIKGNKEVADKLTDMLEAVRNKRTNKTMSKTQIENEDLKSLILVVMESGKCYTCTMLMKELNDERITSQQKMSALLNALVKENKVEKIIDKKSTFFKRVA